MEESKAVKLTMEDVRKLFDEYSEDLAMEMHDMWRDREKVQCWFLEGGMRRCLENLERVYGVLGQFDAEPEVSVDDECTMLDLEYRPVAPTRTVCPDDEAPS